MNAATKYSTKYSGLTLIELLVVLLIIGGMLSLLFPSIQRAREAARRATCQNNLRQLSFAMRGYVDAYKQVPKPSSLGIVSGWPVALLPFMENGALADMLTHQPSLNSIENLEAIRNSPRSMRCPSAFLVDETSSGFAAAHYALAADSNRLSWRLNDIPAGVRSPWLVGVELDDWDLNNKQGPHDGGFLVVNSDSAVNFRKGQAE